MAPRDTSYRDAFPFYLEFVILKVFLDFYQFGEILRKSIKLWIIFKHSLKVDQCYNNVTGMPLTVP